MSKDLLMIISETVKLTSRHAEWVGGALASNPAYQARKDDQIVVIVVALGFETTEYCEPVPSCNIVLTARSRFPSSVESGKVAGSSMFGSKPSADHV